MKRQRLEKANSGATGDLGSDDAFLLSLGIRVRARRAELGVSQEELAAISGMSIRYLYSVEKGRQNVCILILRRIALALKMPMEQLTQSGDKDHLRLSERTRVLSASAHPTQCK